MKREYTCKSSGWCLAPAVVGHQWRNIIKLHHWLMPAPIGQIRHHMPPLICSTVPSKSPGQCVLYVTPSSTIIVLLFSCFTLINSSTFWGLNFENWTLNIWQPIRKFIFTTFFLNLHSLCNNLGKSLITFGL